MKHRSFTSQLLLAAGVATVISAATVYGWPHLYNHQTMVMDVATTEDLRIVAKDIFIIKEKLKQTDELHGKIAILNQTITQLEKEIADQKIQQPPVAMMVEPESLVPESKPMVQDSSLDFKILSQELITGSVLKETLDNVNKNLPQDQQLPPDLMSIRDLLDQLQSLPELKREVDVTVNDSLIQKGMDWAGLKVRKAETTTLKEQVINGLKIQDFSFLVELDQLTLSSDWSVWLKQCHQTQMALDLVKAVLTQTSAQSRGDSQ